MFKISITLFALILIQLPQSAFAETATIDTATSSASSAVTQQVANKIPIEGTFELLPIRWAFVDDNEQKFRADHWIRDGYSGGVNYFESNYKTKDDIHITMEGRGIFDEDPAITRNDYDGHLLIKKEDIGFIDVEFEEFPKYYDNRGGVYYPFRMFSGTNLDRELELDIAKLVVTAGLTLKDVPEIEFEYEREVVNGAKSRTTWANAVESGITRKIAPSWQEIDEVVNAFAIKAKHKINEYELHGEQHWEMMKAVEKRYEKNLGTTAAQRFYNRQIAEPEATVMTTIVGAERWYQEEKYYSSLNYRFSRNRNSEKENLREFNENFNLFSFTAFAENRKDARADNHMDSHTAVLNLRAAPEKWLIFNNKSKVELWRSRGNSTYPYDLGTGPAVPAAGATPDEVIDQTIFSDNTNRTFKVGDDFGIRFKKIPRTALYAEFGVEKARNWLSEDRWFTVQQATGGFATGEVFSRRSIIDMLRMVAATGVNVTPIQMINSTAQVRYRRDDTYFNDKRQTLFSSAFFDEMTTDAIEAETRTTFRPCNWFRPSFRYIVRDIDTHTRTEGLAGLQESGILGNTYVLDVTMIPHSQISTFGSFTREELALKTPAAAYTASGIPLPGFNSDVDTWLLGVDYAPKDNVSVTSTTSVSIADNFDDFTSIGMPMEASFTRVGFTLGVKWLFRKDITIEPRYEFYHYGPSKYYDHSSYNAYLASIEVSVGLT